MADSIKIIKEEESPQWLNRAGKLVKMSEMTEAQLRRAKKYAQSRILYFHNKASFYDLKTEELDAEGEKRGIELEDYDREFFKRGEDRVANQESTKTS